MRVASPLAPAGRTIGAVERLTDHEMRAWRAFLGAHAAVISQLTTEMKDDHDLALTWYDVLVQLQEAGGSLRMHQLAARLMLSRSATTRFVDRLQAAGLIHRETCSSDRRGTFVVLTDLGFQRLREAAPSHLDGVKRIFAAALSKEELEVIADALGKLAGERGHLARPAPAGTSSSPP